MFLARFVAVLRTIGSFLAGVSNLRYRNSQVFDAAGRIVWATLYGLLAYALGRQFDR